MLPIIFLGNNLGDRHKELNALVNEAFNEEKSFQTYIHADELSDADRLFKIHLAVKIRDVDYIIETLKSDDMLYVSHALKATWLITDELYINIINPKYLYTVLFNQMFSEAVRKMKLKIRSYLRSEERCEQFYEYHFNVLEDLNGALVFLPYCSKNFIKTVIDNEDVFTCHGPYFFEKKKGIHFHTMLKVFKRVSEMFQDLAEPMIKKVSVYTAEHMVDLLNVAAISQADHYLYLLETYCRKFETFPKITAHLSRKIAKTRPEKLFDKLDVYLMRIDHKSVGNIWSKEKVISWIEIVSKNNMEDVKNWFCRENIQNFLIRMSDEEKNTIYDKYFQIEEIFASSRDQYIYKTKYNSVSYICAESVYKWYKRFTFPSSFNEIKQLFRAIQSAENRCALFVGLLKLAGDDLNHIDQVIQYYFIFHMNEQAIYKVRFLDELVETKHIFHFNEECWKTINDLFISLEVYADENFCSYAETVIFYNVLHNMEVPDVILDKYYNAYNNRNQIERLSEEERSKIYDYLVKELESKCHTVRAKEGLSIDYYNLVANYMAVVRNWEKCVIDYPTIIYAITDMVQFKPDEFFYSSNLYVAVICHHVIRETAIPVKIMEKYLANGYSNDVYQMIDTDKLKAFNYFVKDFENRSKHMLIQQAPTTSLQKLTISFIRLLRQNKRSLIDFSCLVNVIKLLVIREPNCIDYPLCNAERRLLFDVSILMSQHEDTLINILKHEPNLIRIYMNRITNFMSSTKYLNFFKKLVTYFPNDLTIEFQNLLKIQVRESENNSTHIKFVAANLSALSKKKEYIDTIANYLPNKNQVEWEEENIDVVNIRKHLASNFHQIRPFLDMDTIYQFAKGDYLQYALPSLLSICTAYPLNVFSEILLPKLLNSPVSIQKHGIRLAFKRLTFDQVCHLVNDIWLNSENLSIRNIIFKSTFRMLIKQVKEDKISALWELIKTFVANLQEDEEMNILEYNYKCMRLLPCPIICKSVPICYRKMERIKLKIDWSDVRSSLLDCMTDWLKEGMDLDFVSVILLEYFNENFHTIHFHVENNSKAFLRLFCEYLTFSEENQDDRYETVARPIFSSICVHWSKQYQEGSVQIFFGYILQSFMNIVKNNLKDGKGYERLFTLLFQQFKTLCALDKHFIYYLKMKLLIIFNNATKAIPFLEGAEFYKRVSVYFSNSCAQLVENLVHLYFPSISVPILQTVYNFTENILHESSDYNSGMFFVSFIDNLVEAKVVPSKYLLGLYFYNRLKFIACEEFDKQANDYFERVKLRIRKIEHTEIQFHLCAEVL